MVKTGYMMNDLKQLLEKAKSLKTAIDGLNGLDSDGSCTGELVSNLTSLQDLYKQLLIKNLEYALDKKIDHDLWNGIFKNRITAMQQRAKDKKNARRTEAQNQLTAFLDSASGFYSSLLHELCQTFNVDIPGRVKANKLNLLRDNVTTESSCISQPERNSCQYMCQHCLVHLGDIARYRNQIGQAESYYHHAAQLLPSSGHPYNQLAILAAANGELLKMAFFYCRSIAVKGPFPGSDTNLRRQLSKIISGDDPKYQKISTSELLKFFLKLHACIYLKKKDNELPGMVERLSNFIRAHLRAGSLSHQQIIHMAFINLFSLQHLAPRGIRDGMPIEASCKRVTSPKNDSNDSTAIISTPPNSDHSTTDDPANLPSQHKPWNAMLAFVLQNLGELLACIPVHSDELSELEHPALPAIKLLLDWLTTNSSVLKRKDIAQYSRVWPRLAKVLNALGNQDKANDMNGCPLPEDIEVRGFIGLFSSLQKLNFKASVDNLNNNSNSYASMTDKQHACRCYRLFQLGVVIVDHNSQLLHTKEENNSTVFSSSVLPSPQHAHNYNGLDDSTDHHHITNNFQRTQLNNSSSTSHHDNGVVDGLDYEVGSLSLSSPRRSNAVSVSSGEARSTSLANFDAVAIINARETRNRNLLKNSTNSTEFTADSLLATGGGNGAGLRRNPRMQNVPVQMKPDYKLKVIKEEDMATSTGSSKFLQDNLADGSESGDASNAESLSQSDILSAASPCNVPPSSNNNATSNRTGNRVTFAANPTGFSPAPYLNEQSPSPSSLTDSFTAESSSAMAMYLSDVGSPQKQQQQQQQHVMSQQAFRPIVQQPPINRAMYRPPSSFQPSPADGTVFSTNHRHNSDPFNNHPGYGGFPPAQQPPNIQASKQQNPPRFPLMPPPPFPSNSAVDPAAYLPPGAPMFQSDGMPLQYPPHHMRIKPEHMSEQQQNNLLNQQQRMQASAGDFTNMFFPPAQKPNEMGPLKQPDLKNPISLYGLQSWNFPIPTNIPPPVLPPGSPSLVDISHAVRMNAALRRDIAAVDKNQRPPVTQQQQNMYKNAGGGVPIVNHSASPYRTAEPGQFNHSMMLEQQQHRQGGKDNNAPSLSNGSMKGVSQNELNMLEATGGANMSQSMAAAMRGMAAANTTAGSSSYSRRENVSGLHHQNDFAASVSEALMKSNSQYIPEHSSGFPLGKTEESYKLFPDTDNSWGIGRGNNEGEGFGSSALGTIGSERAAAAQQQQYSPWSAQMVGSGGGGISGTPPNNNHHPSDAMSVAGGGGSSMGKVPSAIIDSHNRNPNYSSQSFWSSPMVASSALEQLIRQQQQTGSGATGGSGKNDPPP